MTVQHFDDQHHEPFWKVTAFFETLIITGLEVAVIGSFILALFSLAQYSPH